MTAKDIKYIVIHCSAGHGDLASIKAFWLNVLKWATGGYHRFVDFDGTITALYPFTKVVNGVKNYNQNAIHISYRGGVDKLNVKVSKDTRTIQQKASIITCIVEALVWINNNGGNVDQVKILGHRDLSPDKNGNGIIESWERIKECPSFNAIKEYQYLQPKN
jgi:N-acetylmuramoyl-L-alanine amidase